MVPVSMLIIPGPNVALTDRRRVFLPQEQYERQLEAMFMFGADMLC